jgi:hypothetical protein
MAFSRRDFLKRTCCTAAAGFAAASFNRFGLVNALAQGTQDYKALVCVFLFGGNDSNNMVVPFSSSGYASYQSIRSVLALPQNSLLPIAPPSAGSFGFHPKFTELQALFNQKHLAVMAWFARPPALSSSRAEHPFHAICSRTKTSKPRCRPPHSIAPTVRRDGRGERRTRFSRSMEVLFRPSFLWRDRIFFAKASRLERFSRAGIRPGCSRDLAARRNRRAVCQHCRAC